MTGSELVVGSKVALRFDIAGPIVEAVIQPCSAVMRGFGGLDTFRVCIED